MDLNLRNAICTTCGIRVCDGVQHDDRVFRVLFVVGVGDKVCVFGAHTSVQCIRQAHKNLQSDDLGKKANKVALPMVLDKKEWCV